MSLARKMQRGLQRSTMRETKKRTATVRAVVDTLSPSQREKLQKWIARNPTRIVTPELVRSVVAEIIA